MTGAAVQRFLRPMIRLYAIPFSTNVERVALALAQKGIDAEVVMFDAADRTPVRELSGQDLVPVIEHDRRVIADSPVIIEYLEELQPDPPLYPADPARAAEMRVFIDWFNRVWKGAPNAIADALDAGDADQARLDALGQEMTRALAWFEALLAGRDFLFGDRVSAADFVAFPFLKYAVDRPRGRRDLPPGPEPLPAAGRRPPAARCVDRARRRAAADARSVRRLRDRCAGSRARRSGRRRRRR